jgi:hypothetical protein
MSTNWPFGAMPELGAPEKVRKIADLDLNRYGARAEVQTELKRYFLLRLLWNKPITLESRTVDELWHAFILDTKRYRTFCELVFEGYLDHESSHFAPTEGFPSGYQQMFGEALPEVWTRSRPPAGFDSNCA